MQEGRWTIEQCDWEAVSTLARELELSEVAATILVRRGHHDPAETAAFLAAAPPEHDPFLLGDMQAAVARIKQAVERDEKICIHGDYDADGVCATAVAYLALRELGANVSWHLPSRFEEGYGLARETIERLAAEGVGLIVTVDCGITAVAEVARARELGVDVVITDHHRPGDVLPECLIVATRPSEYPFPELAGTGVAYKLAVALLGAGHPALTRDLDLVALGTIADVVPLVDENRALAAAGLRALACTTRPGLRALMRSAHVDPAMIDSTSVSFRLAPRINAAGRLRRPDLALELILTEDPALADSLAAELESLNRERQSVEERILREAIATVKGWSAEQKARRAYVIWGEEWHEGVIGIVASRLVERFGRPVVLIARSTDGWKGSGRSTGSFDLHAGLAACAEHLERFGGHRAAAGLSIATESLEPFAAAFAAYAAGVIADDELQAGDEDRRHRPCHRAHARSCTGASTPGALRACEPRAGPAGGERATDRALDRRRGQASSVPGQAARAMTEAARSPSGSDRRSSGWRRGATTSPSSSPRITGTERSHRSSSSGACSTRPWGTTTCVPSSQPSGATARQPGHQRPVRSSPSSRSASRPGAGSCSNHPRFAHCSATVPRRSSHEPRSAPMTPYGRRVETMSASRSRSIRRRSIYARIARMSRLLRHLGASSCPSIRHPALKIRNPPSVH